MKTTYLAPKDLVIADKQVKKGDVLFTIETDHPVDRMLAGVNNGAAVPADPTPAAEPATESSAPPVARPAKAPKQPA